MPRRHPYLLRPRRRVGVAVTAALAALATVLLTAAPAQAGGCGEPFTGGPGSTVVMTLLCYRPAVVHVEPGEAVTFVNQDTTEHPTSGRSGSAAEDAFVLPAPPRSRQTVRYDQEGTFPFACMRHAGMVGMVVVGDGEGQLTPVAAPDPTGGTGAASQQSGQDASAAGQSGGEAADGGGEGWRLQPLSLAVAAAVGAALALLVRFLLRRRTPTAPR